MLGEPDRIAQRLNVGEQRIAIRCLRNAFFQIPIEILRPERGDHIYDLALSSMEVG